MNNDKIYEEYAELVRRIKSGDESATVEIYEKSKRLVYATCFGILNNNEDAQDAMQETYMTVFSKMGELSDENKFLGWIKRVSASKALDMYRKKRGDISYDEVPVTEGDDDLESLPDTYIMEKTKRDILNDFIRKELSDVQYQTILLYYYDELPVETIAKLMNCPEGTVKTRLKSSRVKIKSAVEGYEKENRDSLAGMAVVPFLAKFFMETSKDISVPSVRIAPPKATPKIDTPNVAKEAGKATMNGAKKLVAKSFLSTVGGKIVAGAVAALMIGAGAVAIKTVIDKKDEPHRRVRDEKEETEEYAEIEETEASEEIVPSEEVTEPSESAVVVFDEPIELSADEVAEPDQLKYLIGCFDITDYDYSSVPDDLLDQLMFTDAGMMIDLTPYFDDYDPSKGKTDPLGLFENDCCSRVNYDYLVWTEENILNISPEDIERINSVLEEVPSEYGSTWGHYLGSDGYIYMAKGDIGDSDVEEILKITFDGEYYYVISNEYDLMLADNDPGYDPMEDGTLYLNVMKLKEIDGKTYWTIIRRSVTSKDALETASNTTDTTETEQLSTDNVDLTGDVDFTKLEDNGWKDAYRAMVDSVTQDDFNDGMLGTKVTYTLGYDLVFINNDQIPELVCCLNSETGDSWINIYTYVDGETVMLGSSLYRYVADVTYVPSGNLIGAGGGRSEAGAVWYSSYWMMSDDCKIIETVEYESSAYDLLKYDSVSDALQAGENCDSHDYHYVYDPENKELIELSEEELNEINEKHMGMKSLYTTKTAEEFNAMLG